MKFCSYIAFSWICFFLVLAGKASGQNLVGHWTFEPGEELLDRTGNFSSLILKDVEILDGYLHLDSASGAHAKDYSGPNIYSNRTMVCWLELNDLDAISGHLMTTQAKGRAFKESILYHGLYPRNWNQASEFWSRSFLDSAVFEETKVDTLLQIAIVSKELDKDRITVTIYRNGEKLVTYEALKSPPFYTGSTEVCFGFDGRLTDDFPMWMDCKLEEARLYNKALSQEEIKSLSIVKVLPPTSHYWWIIGAVLLLVAGVFGYRKVFVK
jgi:hypothetical protein